MWDSRVESLQNHRGQRFTVLQDGRPVPYAEVPSRWSGDGAFRSFFISLLRDAPFPAFRWETPPITKATADRDFEFVLLSSAGLDRTVDRMAFADHFSTDADVVTFPNLGGDAVLVVPCPVADESAYGHLASFVRGAPEAQVHHLWRAAGEAMQQRLGKEPVWLSTAGMGVSWLHVRLDSRPKYYGYAPYKRAP